MPGYVNKELKRFGYPTLSKPQHPPHLWEVLIYGAKIQYAPIDPDHPLLPPEKLTRVQQIVGIFLYYARAINITIFVAPNAISSEEASTMTNTNQAIAHLWTTQLPI